MPSKMMSHMFGDVPRDPYECKHVLLFNLIYLFLIQEELQNCNTHYWDFASGIHNTKYW